MGHEFVIWPGVLNPVVFRTGRYLAKFIGRTSRLNPGSGSLQATALDLGTGCGILAVFAALRGYKVIATDIEPTAVSCARANAILNHVEDRITVAHGDLFAPVAGRRFDLVTFNLPFFRGSAQNARERAWMSLDAIDRCARGLPAVLKPDGAAYFVLSSHGDALGMLTGLRRGGLDIERIHWRHFGVETLAIYGAHHPK